MSELFKKIYYIDELKQRLKNNKTNNEPIY